MEEALTSNKLLRRFKVPNKKFNNLRNRRDRKIPEEVLHLK